MRQVLLWVCVAAVALVPLAARGQDTGVDVAALQKLVDKLTQDLEANTAALEALKTQVNANAQLKGVVDAQAKTIETQKKTIEELKATIAVLKGVDVRAIAKQEAATAIEGEHETLCDLVDAAKSDWDEALKTTVACPLAFRGYIRSRLFGGSEGNIDADVTEIALNSGYQVTDNIRGQFNLWFHPGLFPVEAADVTWVESAYAEFDNFLNTGGLQGRLRFGKDRNRALGIVPSYGNRKMSEYGLFSEFLTQDRPTGLHQQWTGDPFQINLAVTIGYQIGTRPSGLRAAGVTHLADREVYNDVDDPKEYNARVAYTVLDGLTVGASGGYGKLSDGDITRLNELLVPGFADDTAAALYADDERTRYGLDAVYDNGTLIGQGMVFGGQNGDVDFTAFSILGGYRLSDKFDVYVRYDDVNLDITPTTLAASWDQQQLSVSLKYYIAGPAWLQAEYLFNMEDPPSGTSDVDNDLYLLEVFLAF